MDQNAYIATAPLQPCPVCGAPSSERRWQRFASGGAYLRILSKKHTFQGSDMRPLVCYQCGYVQVFVNPEDFR